MRLYTVDRLGTLQSGMSCELVKHDDIEPLELSELVDGLYPDGVAQHGEFHLLRNEKSAIHMDGKTEALFEWVRQARFPARRSRYQCMYGTETIEGAQAFMRRTGFDGCAVYAIETESAFRADMNLLDARMTALVLTYFANLYWSGSPHPQAEPFWEWLIPCPVVIGERVA